MQKRRSRLNSLVVAVGLAACVTVNTYFPDAAVEKTVDRIIEAVWGKEVVNSAVSLAPLKAVSQMSGYSLQGKERKIADFFLRPVVEISIANPAIEAIIASMRQRYHYTLRVYFQEGVIGLTYNGLVALRDVERVPLKEGAWLDKVIVAENTDRKALYRKFSEVNGHPEWQPQVQQTFARRWVKKAPSGWWYQSAQGYWERRG